MSGNLLLLLEIGLVLGGVLAFGFWELWKLRRDRRPKPSRDPKE